MLLPCPAVLIDGGLHGQKESSANFGKGENERIAKMALFSIQGTVGDRYPANESDVLAVKDVLHLFGHYEMPDYGLKNPLIFSSPM